MKSKIVLFLIVLFLTTMDSQAQPGCRGKFSPYSMCQSDYAQADYIFYGEVTSSGKIDHNISINHRSAFYKTTVKVEKTFKGDPPNLMEIYLDYEIICDDTPALNSKHIFNVKKTNLDSKQIYYSEYISRPVTDYSPETLKEVFSEIQSVLRSKKENILEGIIFERLATSRQISLKNEEADRYVLNLGSFKPVAGVLIEAISEQDKKVYRTKSKADGAYKITNIPPGKYKFRTYFTNGEVGETLDIAISSLPCMRKQDVILQKSK